jgi:hypothetical protein
MAAIYSDRLGLVQDILADWPAVEDADPLYLVAQRTGRFDPRALRRRQLGSARARRACSPEHSAPTLPFALTSRVRWWR